VRKILKCFLREDRMLMDYKTLTKKLIIRALSLSIDYQVLGATPDHHALDRYSLFNPSVKFRGQMGKYLSDFQGFGINLAQTCHILLRDVSWPSKTLKYGCQKKETTEAKQRGLPSYPGHYNYILWSSRGGRLHSLLLAYNVHRHTLQ